MTKSAPVINTFGAFYALKTAAQSLAHLAGRSAQGFDVDDPSLIPELEERVRLTLLRVSEVRGALEVLKTLPTCDGCGDVHNEAAAAQACCKESEEEA